MWRYELLFLVQTADDNREPNWRRYGGTDDLGHAFKWAKYVISIAAANDNPIYEDAIFVAINDTIAKKSLPFVYDGYTIADNEREWQTITQDYAVAFPQTTAIAKPKRTRKAKAATIVAEAPVVTESPEVPSPATIGAEESATPASQTDNTFVEA